MRCAGSLHSLAVQRMRLPAMMSGEEDGCGVVRESVRLRGGTRRKGIVRV